MANVSAARSITLMVAGEISPSLDCPVYADRRDGDVRPPFVVVMVPSEENLGVGHDVWRQELRFVLVTDADSTTQAEHDVLLGDLLDAIIALANRARDYGPLRDNDNGVVLYGLVIESRRGASDEETATNGDIISCIAGAGWYDKSQYVA